VEGVASVIDSINETLKTISGLNNTVMLWVLIFSMVITTIVCVFVYFMNRRLKASEDSHLKCLEDKAGQDEKILSLSRSHDGMVAANEQINTQLNWQRDVIDRFFNEKFQ
jgi:hypothetical protein